MPIQKTDIYNPTAPAINYAGAGKTWTIANGVLVGSGSAPAVYSGFNGSKLVNKGDVFSSTNFAVYFPAAKNGTVINKANGSIVGTGGIVVGGPGAKNMTVINDGSIVGLTTYGVVASDVSNFDLTNTGHIFGAVYGVTATVVTPGATDGPMIDNSGVIEGGTFGLVTTALAGLKTTIVNESGGTIQGAVYSIVNGSPGNLLVENHGKIKGIVVGGPATDKIVNDGQIKGEVILSAGNDTYKNAGGTAGRVHGGDGNDTLIAGPHTDKFVFDAALNAATNVDRVKHFDPGTDQLFLSKTFFPALSGLGTLTSAEFHKGTGAHDADDHIIYQASTGNLYYDPDGTGLSPQIQFAKLDKHLNLHHSDFIVIA
jgi:Ca2+-binding RTX toxin-like protein